MDFKVINSNAPAEWVPAAEQVKSPFNASVAMERLDAGIAGALVHTTAMRRLQDVSFLGAIDYSTFWSKPEPHLTSRYHHSVGVALLAEHAACKLALCDMDRHIAVAAALLHDIGHGPLSHSLEKSFEESFGINHHIATEQLLNGHTEAAQELRAVLDQFNVRHEEVTALMEGKSRHPLNWLFGGPINFDTVEGILRAANVSKANITLQPETVIDAALSVMKLDENAERSLNVVDEFWSIKSLMYTQVVRGSIGVMSDYKCQIYFDSHKDEFSADVFGWSEKKIAKKFPELFLMLRDKLQTRWSAPVEIPYVKRTFFICHTAESSLPVEEFFQKRYLQSKDADWLSMAEPVQRNQKELW